jgi:deoxyribonuclease V
MEHDALSLVLADTEEDARRLQAELCYSCRDILPVGSDRIHSIGGAGVSVCQDSVTAAVVAYTYPSLIRTEQATAVCTAQFPYIPGLLAFHTGPAIVRAYGMLRVPVDVLMLPGHGTAHPCRFGLASHIGRALNVRSIGVARRLLTGNVPGDLPDSAGTWPILDAGERVGTALRTAPGRRLLYISPGFGTGTCESVGIVQRSILPGNGFPLPLAEARRLARMRARDARTAKICGSGDS